MDGVWMLLMLCSQSNTSFTISLGNLLETQLEATVRANIMFRMLELLREK